MEVIVTLLVVFVGAFFYFIPTIVANSKHKSNTSAIFVLNLVLGWTFVGWLVALIWAVSNQASDDARQAAQRAKVSTRQCPFCAESIQKAAVVCKHCGREVPNVEPSSAPRLIRCIECKKISPIENENCPNCGHRFNVQPAALGVPGS
jgi:membrane protease subunit (stomatin/prohibitin family)